eukprot:931996-Heterocapsa_arctica.AAC.1
MEATCSTGNTLDWFMLNIGGRLSEYLGSRIRTANAFEGMTKKEIKQSVIPEGDFQTKEGTLEENWIRWNHESETYLCQK